MRLTYVLQKSFQVIVPLGLDQHIFIVNIFDNDVVVVLGVDPYDDGFDGGVAFDENTWGEVIRLAPYHEYASRTRDCTRHLEDCPVAMVATKMKRNGMEASGWVDEHVQSLLIAELSF